jgi:hypothetical protein
MPTRFPKDTSTDDRAGSMSEFARDAPAIPTFDSLRSRRRRSPVDLLVPEPAAQPSVAADRAAPRPPDYADLVRLGVHVARALAGIPVRVTLWSVREPVRLLRRLGRPLGHVPG